MKGLIFEIRLNSLYSIRIPFTWQSALSYPLLPSSAVIGLLANAIQRSKNDKRPIEYLEKLEDEILWAGSRLKKPCVVKSYTTSAITKWEDSVGGKFTNALTRQFCYSKNLEIAIIFKDNESIPFEDYKEALKTSPLTCGDSESPLSLDSDPEIVEVEEEDANTYKEIVTPFPVPFLKEAEIVEGKGHLYLMHERCLKKEDNLPLVSYLFPIEEKGGILSPTTLKIKSDKLKIYKIKERGIYIAYSPISSTDRTERRKGGKK